MISAVFDTTTLLQAATNRKGPAGACLTFVEERHVALFLSPATYEEIRDVLHRPAIRRAFPKLDDEKVQNFLESLMAWGQSVQSPATIYPLPRDPDDEAILNLAIATNASFVVTRDKDLLSLMDVDAFKTQYPALSIIDPKAFLSHVRAQIARDLGYE